ncbi:hypothetical protein G7044_14965 [Paracoccus sp. 12-3]|nr:hypothetical protein [Paracoccus xiamenensis]
MQHGQSDGATEVSGKHAVASMADSAVAGVHHDLSGPNPRQDMSDACVIVCLGTPAPWTAGMQIVQVETERSLKWRLVAVTHEGRRVGPGYRPPKSI